MLFKISIKNIKKSFKDYAIYFFTLILGVSIFYVFNSINSQTIMMDVTERTDEIIRLLEQMLASVSVFVSFILGFLIIYASRFLMKRRNKEFAIYLTLGMSKRKISFLLFLETLLIGLLSLGVGLVLGVFLSQLMSVFVVNLFDADMTKFTFVFSSSACLKCLLYFGIMYLLVMLFNTFSVSKCKLIDLYHASKRSEKLKVKNPFLCIVIFILSVMALSYAYYTVTIGFSNLDTADKIVKPIVLGVVATFFLFFSISGLLLKVIQGMKGIYYKGLNSFIVRQMSSKINTTVFSMTTICLMLFITICVLSSALTIKNSMQNNANALAPADIQLTKSMYVSKAEGYTEEEITDSKVGIRETLVQAGIDLEQDVKDMVEVGIYQTPTLTLRDTLGARFEEVRKQYLFLRYDAKEDIMKVSDYNKIAQLYGLEEFTLKDDEYMVVADFKSMVNVRNMGLLHHEEIEVFGKILSPKYEECKEGFVELSAQHINAGIILVPDEVAREEDLKIDMLVGNYKKSSKQEKIEVEEKLLKKLGNTNIFNNTKIDILNASVGLGALVTFIGLYLGIIFLISSAAILALKELSESSDNKERYRMLRRIGTDEAMIEKALFKQIAIFFFLPLFLAIIHSIFGMLFANKILETYGNEQLLPSILLTGLFLVFIYGGYFFLTYICSKRIIKDN